MFRKIAAAGLSVVLVVLAPGLAPYQAVAAEFAASPASSAHARVAPKIDSLAVPSLGSQAGVVELNAGASAVVPSEAVAPGAAEAAATAPAISAEARQPASAESPEARAAAIVGETTADWTTRSTEDSEIGGAVSGRSASRLARRGIAATPSGKTVPLKISSHLDRSSGSKAHPLAVAAGTAVAGATLLVILAGLSIPMTLAAGVAISVLLHETAHLVTLRHYGDNTASERGVNSALNLIDLRFTALLPLATAWLTSLIPGAPMLLAGWAKQVPADFNNLRDVKKHSGLVALAGPAANAALAVAFAAAAALATGPAAAAFYLLAQINVGLAVFNMLPLPHLDGGKALVALMPESWYARWLHNDKVPSDYQGFFQRLYEGPSALLNFLSMTSQRKVNLVAAGITLSLFAVASLAGWWFLGAPLVMLMLVCSYDYYCIREKIQNEEATRALQGIIQGFAGELAAMAAADESVQSLVNEEEAEHSLKNALENTIDAVVDSEGFEELDAEARWARLEAAYLDAAVVELKRKGMAADDEATIRRLLTSPAGQRYLLNIKQWVERNEVFKKWHSPGRKAKKARKEEHDAAKPAEKAKTVGGGSQALTILAIAGAVGLLTLALNPAGGVALASAGAIAMMAGTVGAPASSGTKPFAEKLDEPSMKVDGKSKQLLLRLLTEMKLDKFPPVIGRVDEMGEVVSTITTPRGEVNSVILVGEKGTGKTAIMEKLALAMALSDGEPAGSTRKLKKMEGRYLLKLNVARLLQEEEPVKVLDMMLETLGRFNEAGKKTGNKAVLVADELAQVMRHPRGQQLADMLLEPMRNGELSVVAGTTRDEYKKHIENTAFQDRMVPIWVNEATTAETLRYMEGRQEYYEDLYELTIEPSALKAAAELSKHDHELYLPRRGFRYLVLAAQRAGFDDQRDRLGLAIEDKSNDLAYVTGKLSERLAKTEQVKDDLKDDEPGTIELYNRAVELTQQLVELHRKRAAVPTEGKPVLTEEIVQAEICGIL